MSRRMWLVVFQASFSVAVVVYLIRFLDWSAVASLLRDGSLYRLWPGPLILLVGLVMAANRWRLVLAALGIALRSSSALYLYLVGTFYGVMLPGVLGGDAVRVALCAARQRGAVSRVLASVAIERGLGLCGVALVGSLGVLALNDALRRKLGSEALLIAPTIVASLLVLIVVLSGAPRLLKWLGGRFVGQRLDGLVVLYQKLWSLPSGTLLSTLLLSTLFQAADILVFYYFAHVMALELPLALCLVVIPIIYLSTVLPISLGGIGVREGVMVWLLGRVGVPVADAVLLAFLMYLNRVALALIGGAVAALHTLIGAGKRT